MAEKTENTGPMTIEEAILTALEYENRVRDLYVDALKKVNDATGRRVFGILAKEEQDHVDYLESRLDEWRKTGHVTPEKLATYIPEKSVIEDAARGLQKQLSGGDLSNEVEMLQRALEAEMTTSAFYRKLVDTLEEEGRALFANFLKIEDGHVALVRHELDAVNGLGFFFDMNEFNLEAG